MQFTKLAFLAAIASSVIAQNGSINDLPTCAVAPALAAIGTTGCGSDIACVCKDSKFSVQLNQDIQAACSPADFEKALSVAVGLCAEAGVTITTSEAASSTATSVPSMTESASAMSSTSEAEMASTTSNATATKATMAMSTGITNTTTPGNGNVSTSAVPSVVTANVAAAHGTWAAAGLLGVGALLAVL